MQGRRSLLGSLEHGFQLLLPSCNPERQKQQCYRRTCRDLKAQFIEPTLRPSAEHSSSSEFLPQGHNHLELQFRFSLHTSVQKCLFLVLPLFLLTSLCLMLLNLSDLVLQFLSDSLSTNPRIDESRFAV